MCKSFTCWFITDSHTNVYTPHSNLVGFSYYNKWINGEPKIIATNRVGISSSFYLATCNMYLIKT